MSLVVSFFTTCVIVVLSVMAFVALVTWPWFLAVGAFIFLFALIWATLYDE